MLYSGQGQRRSKYFFGGWLWNLFLTPVAWRWANHRMRVIAIQEVQNVVRPVWGGKFKPANSRLGEWKDPVRGVQVRDTHKGTHIADECPLLAYKFVCNEGRHA